MIELVRPPESPEADAIADTLREMVAAFREIEDPAVQRPLLRDGERTATGDGAVAVFLADLRRDLARWGRFQSDACYIDDDGQVC